MAVSLNGFIALKKVSVPGLALFEGEECNESHVCSANTYQSLIHNDRIAVKGSPAEREFTERRLARAPVAEKKTEPASTSTGDKPKRGRKGRRASADVRDAGDGGK